MIITKGRNCKEEKVIVKRRSYIKEGEGIREDTTARTIERKREKSEVLLELIEGDYKFSFWHSLTILT